MGYKVDLTSISVAEENIFFNYDDNEPAQIVFQLSKKVKITLVFPEANVCSMFIEVDGVELTGAAAFKKMIDVEIGFVPILGPVEQREPLYEKPAAQAALYNYRAARNFRNIWFHFPLNFGKFRAEVARTWPGMDIEPPEKHYRENRAYLSMYCLENRIARELCWSGFGFQVWCQMLTHLIASEKVSLFLIDEPDIYLHSELQRQLLGILRQLGPDILIATHSTEIISEADSEELVIINRHKKSSKRIRRPAEVADLLTTLGSTLNPTLTQLAKTRRVLFVEGQDFEMIGRFARKLGENGVANRRDFAVISTGGFSPERIRVLKTGIEAALGCEVSTCAVLDRDYRCESECESIIASFDNICDTFVIHDCKEIENFLLVPSALQRAALRKGTDRANRGGESPKSIPKISDLLDEFCAERKFYIQSQLLDFRKKFERVRGSRIHETKFMEEEMRDFNRKWEDIQFRYAFMPGKEALRFLNSALQKDNLGLTDFSIIDAMRRDEVPVGMQKLMGQLSQFSCRPVLD